MGEAMESEDVAANLAIGRHGADSVEVACGSGSLRVLTHCNTGSLATAGFGTALGELVAVFFWLSSKHLCISWPIFVRTYNQILDII